MNTLLIALIRALRRHRWLCLLGCAFVLSSLGNGLTQVVVFGQLLRWQASPATLTLAYMLATLPGFLGSIWGEYLCRKISPLRILILCEVLGMLALILPLYALAAVGSPAMALLPAVAQQMRPVDAAGLALPLLFARSLGQLCGPLLLNADQLRRYAGSNGRLLFCLVLFLSGYFLLPLLGRWPVAGLGLIFGAHLASNVVFALGTFGVLRYFEAEQVATASAMAWRGQVLIAAVATGCAGLLAEGIGAASALYSVSLVSLAGVAILLRRYRE